MAPFCSSILFESLCAHAHAHAALVITKQMRNNKIMTNKSGSNNNSSFLIQFMRPHAWKEIHTHTELFCIVLWFLSLLPFIFIFTVLFGFCSVLRNKNNKFLRLYVNWFATIMWCSHFFFFGFVLLLFAVSRFLPRQVTLLQIIMIRKIALFVILEDECDGHQWPNCSPCSPAPLF